jgi:hypothetical protein
MGSPDKPSEAKGDGYRNVRLVLDRAAQRILKRVGRPSQSFGSVTRNVFCLAVEIFGGPLSPIHGSLDLPLRIASCATHAFLDRPAQIPGGACRSMLIHQTLSVFLFDFDPFPDAVNAEGINRRSISCLAPRTSTLCHR